MREDIDFFYVVPSKRGDFPVTAVGIGRADQSLWIEVAASAEMLEWLAELRREEGAVVLRDKDGRIFVEMRAVIASCKSPERRKELTARAEAWVEHLHPSNFRPGPGAFYEIPK